MVAIYRVKLKKIAENSYELSLLIDMPKIETRHGKHDIFELLTLGDKNNYYYYIHNDKQKVSGGYGFIVNNNLPFEYQNLQHENTFLKQEMGYLQEKINFLEDKIKNLEKIIDLKSK